MSETNYLQQIANQINQITQSLDGTIAQIDSLHRGLEDNSQKLTENLTALNENMRLVITVIKKGRSNQIKTWTIPPKIKRRKRKNGNHSTSLISCSNRLSRTSESSTR